MEKRRPTKEIIDEIMMKLTVYGGGFDFDGDVTAEINDGNRFDVRFIKINEKTYGVQLQLYSEVTGRFTVAADYRIDNLEEISESIPVPCELCVQVFIKDGDDEHFADVYTKMLVPGLSAGRVMDIITNKFPAIRWSEDGTNKWEGVPYTAAGEDQRVYFVATFGDEF